MGDTSWDMWQKIQRFVEYDENIHCPLILKIFDEGGSMSDFYVETGASPQRVGRWLGTHPEFFESVQLAKELGKRKWLNEAQENIDNKAFNKALWSMIGKRRFGSAEKINITINTNGSPLDHYKQIMTQAANGDFTASELKQIMESVNIGLRAHEICELQNEINGLKDGLRKMEERELEYQIANQPVEKENQAALDGENGEGVHS